MAKFYLHMQAGENLGKVTKLKYVDDVSDDELTIYVFADGSKCDETYVAEVNSMDAFNGRYVMTEITDPTNKWEFTTVEFNLETTKKVVDDNGIEYEIPEAGIGLNGEHVSMSFSEDGTPIHRIAATAGKRTDSTPPRVYKNKKVEPIENYLLSLHPELEHGAMPTQLIKTQTTPSLPFKLTNKQSYETTTQTPVILLQKPVMLQLASPISTSVTETIKHAEITINLEDLCNGTYEQIKVISKNGLEILSPEEFYTRILNNTVPTETSSPCPCNETGEEHPEDILISNMIDRSKKTGCTIGIDIEMELPPKEVYSTIKTVYPEGMTSDFVNSLAERTACDELKKALTIGLTAFYEGANNLESTDK